MATTRRIGVLVLFLLFAQASWAAAGRFLTVVGDVRLVNSSGDVQRAAKGAVLNTGDTVVTGARALAQVRLTDGGTLSVRAGTELKVDDYAFAGKNDTAGRMFLRLLRGGLRSITGLIGKTNRRGYGIRTPHATIGVRGTVHETTVILKPTGGLQPGTIEMVLEGASFMRTNAGTVNVNPRQAAYVGSRAAVPKIIPVPAFLRPRLGAVAPAVQGKGKAKAAASGKGDQGTASPAKPIAPRVSKKALINPLVSPSTRTLTSPTTTLRSPTTSTLTSPTTILKSPTTSTLTSPTTILKSPTTSTLTSPTTTLRTPTTSTLTSPTTTAPTTILRTPSTTVAPKITAPTTTTTSPIRTAPKLTAPKLTAPITTTR